MATVQQWGRKESVIWPPRGYIYTLGAFLFACILTGLFIYLRFQFGLLPLQRYYLPYYLRTETAGLTHPLNAYQLLYVSGGESPGRVALDADVQPGSTSQFEGKPLPLTLTSQAAHDGAFFLRREPLRSYQNRPLHEWIAHWIYQDVPLYKLFTMQFIFGIVAFVLQLPFSIRKDLRRIKELRYGRRLKGPVLVNAKQFTKAVAGTGIGITTEDFKLPLRIPRDAENKHFLIVGDTGTGKSSVIRQMLYQVEARGDSAIVYDPACEFVKQFYNPHRGDIVLNPLDARMPYWNPSKELRRRAEAKALAVSLYQPEGVSNRFFVEAPQKIFAHLLTYLPTPEDLVKWMSDPAEIDRRVKGTEYWMLIDPKAPQQRTGVLGSLNMSADGTPEAERAVEVAISLAQSLRAKLILLGVVGPPSPESQAEGYGLETVTQSRERLNEGLHRKVRASAQSEIEVVTEVFEGKPDEVIVQRVEQDSVDLVVIGRRDIARVRHWLEGSTSENLVRDCPVSVLVVRDDHG